MRRKKTDLDGRMRKAVWEMVALEYILNIPMQTCNGQLLMYIDLAADQGLSS